MMEDDYYLENWDSDIYFPKAMDYNKPGGPSCTFLDRFGLDISVKNFEKSKQIPSKCTRPAPNG